MFDCFSTQFYEAKPFFDEFESLNTLFDSS